MANTNSHMAKNKSMDFRKLVTAYLKYWYLFIIGSILCLTLAFIYLRYKAIAQYNVTSTLLISDKERGGTTSGASNSFNDLGLITPNTNIADQIGILKSFSLWHKVMGELPLDVNYQLKGRVKDISIYEKNSPIQVVLNNSVKHSNGIPIGLRVKSNTSFELIETGQDGESQNKIYDFGQEIKRPYGSFTVINNTDKTVDDYDGYIIFQFTDIDQLASDYSTSLKVESVNEAGGLLQLSLMDAIPHRGEDILNKLMEVYKDEAVAYKNKLANASLDLIDDRLSLLTNELNNVEKNVEEYKQKNDLTNVTSDAEMYLQQASQYKRQMSEYDIQIDVLNSIQNYLESGDESTTVPSSLNISDATLVSLIGKFNDLQIQRRRMLETTPKNNPVVVDMDKQISSLKTNILENLKNVKNGLIITRNNLRSNSLRYQSQISKVPTAERGLTEISREKSTKQEIYLYLLQKREEEALSVSSAVANSRIIDPARSLPYPSSPNKTSLYLGSLIFGLFVPFSFVYVKQKMNNKVRDINDIEELTATPILGKVAHNGEKNNLVTKSKMNNQVAELFRLIRFNLKFIAGSSPNQVILITSSNKGEGKTFFTINLGASLATSGKKVVALSFDLRAPKLLKDLGIAESKGITDYIVDEDNSIQKMIRPCPEISNFDIIGSGSIPPNPGEIMLSPKIKDLIDELRAQYDYVLIDSAPVGKVADAYSLQPYIDTTIFIVRQNYTRKSDLDTLNTIYVDKKLNSPLIILNDVHMRKEEHYGYGNEI